LWRLLKKQRQPLRMAGRTLCFALMFDALDAPIGVTCERYAPAMPDLSSCLAMCAIPRSKRRGD
jgi:hypothetical protein